VPFAAHKTARVACLQVPLENSIRHHSDAGTPVVVSSPDSEGAGVFLAIAAKIKAKLKLDTLGS
jgi:MinD-like ATPase involved in chromosome partitioning or flagellar assembly